MKFVDPFFAVYQHKRRCINDNDLKNEEVDFDFSFLIILYRWNLVDQNIDMRMIMQTISITR